MERVKATSVTNQEFSVDRLDSFAENLSLSKEEKRIVQEALEFGRESYVDLSLQKQKELVSQTSLDNRPMQLSFREKFLYKDNGIWNFSRAISAAIPITLIITVPFSAVAPEFTLFTIGLFGSESFFIALVIFNGNEKFYLQSREWKMAKKRDHAS